MTEANAAAEGVPIEAGNDTPNPIEHAPAVEKKPPTLDEALDKAFAEAEKRETDRASKEAKPKAEEPKEKTEPKAKDTKAPEAKDAKPKEPAKDEPEKAVPHRGEDGKFLSSKPKEQEAPQPKRPHDDPPARFNDNAKAEWANVPEQTRAEVHRALRENEAGIQKYKADADAFGEVKDFHDMAKHHGSNLRQALTQYVALEMALKGADPARKSEAIASVFNHAGINPRAWAGQLLDRAVDFDSVQAENANRQLRNQNDALHRENAALKSQLQEHTVNMTVQQIQRFSSEHDRFEELAAEIELEIKMLKQAAPDLTPDELLIAAYKRADRLNPRTNSEPLTPADVPPAQTRTTETQPNAAGLKSISGAPAAGSDPAIPPKRKGKTSTIDDALDRAFARLAS